MGEMLYRKVGRTGDEVSVIGIGTSSNGPAGAEETARAVTMALDNGVNYFDLAAADGLTFEAFGKALRGRREEAMLQMHFGADYATGAYGRVYGLESIRMSVAWQMAKVGTDYIDYGFIHCIDEPEALDEEWENGTVEYIQELKDEGTVRHIGISTHTPSVAQRALDSGIVDMVMFSINPAFDYRKGEYAYGEVDERADLYRRCLSEGVGISVMKAFGGGQLVDASLSPFGRSLTTAQCIQYALDRPGVVTVLAGIRDRRDLEGALSYLDSSPEDRDYSVIGDFAPPDAEGKCIYCNHCQPCPSGLDIGLINKYYDLARAGDRLAADHYASLAVRAGACTACGHCDDTCPFNVGQVARMAEIREYFGG